jgi:endonuclease/exonuclease/phosphatase family metal-dependent hydrolase
MGILMTVGPAFAVLIGLFLGLFVLNRRSAVARMVADNAPEPEPLREQVTLRIATQNVKALYLLSSNREDRMQGIADLIIEHEADMVCFQEVFIAKCRQILVDRLAEAGLEHHVYFRCGLIGSGLLFVSRYPIVETRFERYKNEGNPFAIHHGDYWAGKGVASIRVVHPVGHLVVYGTHAHAAYKNRYTRTRLLQMRQAAAFIHGTAVEGVPNFVLGDINCERHEDSYEALVEGAELTRMMSVESDIDHVFLRHAASHQAETIDTAQMAGIYCEGGVIYLHSDHFGYCSEVRIAR